MYFAPQEYHLFDGQTAVIRSPLRSDTAAFARYTDALASQGQLLWFNRASNEAEYTREFLLIEKNPHKCLLLFLLNDEVVAHTFGFVHPRSATPSLFAFNITVHGKYREYDIDIAMFAAAEHVARTLGATQMSVSFPNYDTRSRTLYENNGFVEQPDPFFGTHPNGLLEYFVHMLKQL